MCNITLSRTQLELSKQNFGRIHMVRHCTFFIKNCAERSKFLWHSSAPPPTDHVGFSPGSGIDSSITYRNRASSGADRVLYCCAHLNLPTIILLLVYFVLGDNVTRAMVNRTHGRNTFQLYHLYLPTYLLSRLRVGRWIAQTKKKKTLQALYTLEMYIV